MANSVVGSVKKLDVQLCGYNDGQDKQSEESGAERVALEHAAMALDERRAKVEVEWGAVCLTQVGEGVGIPPPDDGEERSRRISLNALLKSSFRKTRRPG